MSEWSNREVRWQVGIQLSCNKIMSQPYSKKQKTELYPVKPVGTFVEFSSKEKNGRKTGGTVVLSAAHAYEGRLIIHQQTKHKGRSPLKET